jgi:rhodanese-related sulfurtransferase
MTMRVAIFVARWLMAGIFIYASADKIVHPAAFALDVYNYRILPDACVSVAALVLPWLELLLGLCLLSGFWLPGAVLAVNGLLVVFFAALVFNLARGLDVHCGCFGSAVQGAAMSTGNYLLRDAGFLCVGAFLLYAVFGRQGRVGPQPVPDREHAGERRNASAGLCSAASPERRHRISAAATIHGRAALQVAALVLLSALAALTVNRLRSDSLPLAFDGPAAARTASAGGEGRGISLSEAQQLFAAGAAVFLDARSAQEYARGRIRGARSLPWGEVDDRFIGATEELDLQTPIVTYCDGESCELSHQLARFLAEAGFVNARVLVNGWALWRQAGLPIESGRP